MPRLVPHQAQQGFLTIAQNTAEVDYLKLAYIQAMSIKMTMPGSLYAVIVDQNTMSALEDKHQNIFDFIIPLHVDYAKEEIWKLSNEWQVFDLSPFKETIKLEADILFTRSIKHWWSAFRLRDIVLSTGCRDYQENLSAVRDYRKVFDDNELPDTYSGLMYFRYSQTAAKFFDLSHKIYSNWKEISTTILRNCRDPHPTTDVVYALTAKIIGSELCTIPSLDWINFIHMKPAINKWPNKPWNELVICELDLPMIRVANTNQYHPWHYHDKLWADDTIIKGYETWMQTKNF